MAKRIIEISVNDEYVVGSGVVIGAEGADESVILRVAFGDAWAGLNIYATFRDSKGESPTVELLMPSMRVLDATVIKYDVVVPRAATAHAGKMSVVFSGFAVSEVSSYEIKTGAEENIKLVYRDAVINTTNAYFRVLPSDFSALDVKDHTEATVLEQVLSEINAFRDELDEQDKALDDFGNTLDGKVSKITTSHPTADLLYGQSSTGKDTQYAINPNPSAWNIPRYDTSKVGDKSSTVLRTGTPLKDGDCANKNYVDNEMKSVNEKLVEQDRAIENFKNETIGDISSALDELHDYAQNIISGEGS